MSTVEQIQISALTKRLLEVRARALQPPPQLTLSQWAEQYMMLSPEASSLPGKFRFDRAVFQRGVFDALTDDNYKKVVIMSASQILKTQALLCYIGYIVHSDPGPILVVQPTGKMAQAFSKDRVDTMLRDVPVLHGRVRDKRERDSGNTTLHKLFPAGALTIATSNSPSDLASRPIRYLLCDEVDRYGPTEEGDPIALAKARTTTFWNSKEVYVSSPGDEEISRINAEYQLSDKRIFMVPCNGCGTYQQLVWRQVKWTDGPHTAYYECEACGEQWSNQQKNLNVTHGYWQITNPTSDVAGFHISNIYSSFKSLSQLVSQWLSSKHDPEQLRGFLNTMLGETWKTQATTISNINFLNRLEKYTPDSVPNGVVLITAGVDMQQDRLEMEVVGWGIADESWSIEYKVIHGDPTSPAPWEQLEDYLNKVYTRQDGIKLKINAVAIDTGSDAARSTPEVFAFARKHSSKNIYPIKGIPGPNKMIFPKKNKYHRKGGRFYPVGVDGAKERLYGQLVIDKPGPGYCHFPVGYDDFYFEGLTVEKYTVKYKKGHPYKQWFKKDSERNEPLDCRVYAMAARLSFSLDMTARTEMLENKAKEIGKNEQVQEAPAVPHALEPLLQKPQTLVKPPRRTVRPGGGYISGLT